jgi:hypothetical protein
MLVLFVFVMVTPKRRAHLPLTGIRGKRRREERKKKVRKGEVVAKKEGRELFGMIVEMYLA